MTDSQSTGNPCTNCGRELGFTDHTACPQGKCLTDEHRLNFDRATSFRITRVHSVKDCSGEYCIVHNPSPKAIAMGELNWRPDRGLFFERVCEHGVGHPDPDHMAHLKTLVDRGLLDQAHVDAEGVHGCCIHRCCQKGESE